VPSILITPPLPPLNLRGGWRGYQKEEQKRSPSGQGVAAKYFSVNPASGNAVTVYVQGGILHSSGFTFFLRKDVPRILWSKSYYSTGESSSGG